MRTDCNIVICGDLCPTPDTEAQFDSGDARGLFRGVCDVFAEANLLVGNLEYPLTDAGRGIVKCGPVLKGSTSSLSALRNAGFKLLGLANNHIRDCGDEGVLSTLACCERAGIAVVGGGESSAAARRPAVIEIHGWRIGILAFAEHEMNAATGSHAGANVFDPYQSYDDIAKLSKECDRLIVLYHGGIEHYVYPSPLLQKKCRKMADCGADLVLCQHSHCVGTVESYAGATILYGQGNTVFGYRKSAEWNDGLIVRMSLSPDAPSATAVEYLPIRAAASGIDLMPADEAKVFLARFLARSERIADPDFVASSWRSYCESRKALYLPQLLGLGRVLNVVNRKLGNRLVSLLFSRRRMQITMNLVRCEAHHEVVRTILEAETDGV